MTIGIVGIKQGMTRIFTEDGQSVPVTVIQAGPNRVTQIKTMDTDGYRAVQVTYGETKLSKVTKPAAGHFKKANVDAGRKLIEFVTPADTDIEVGGSLTLESFIEGQLVDVTGESKGKGFQGVIKRHNFSMQDATHGNSLAHRAPGSIGQNQTPGRVFKGKKMSGHLGNVTRTAQNLEVVRVDAERNLILVKGSVPGHKGGRLIVSPAAKVGGQEAQGAA